MDESRKMSNGSLLNFERIYPLDAAFDTLADAPDEIKGNKRYKELGDFSIDGLVQRLTADFGASPLDIVVHSLANGPEVKKPLMETSRAGYLAAVGVSAYSLVSMVARLAPMMRPGRIRFCRCRTWRASTCVIPGYGGGMSSAKAALESDTRTLAYEAGRRYGVRVNTISAGPFASRAASAIGIIDAMVEYCAANTPIPQVLTASEVGTTAARSSRHRFASGITGDHGSTSTKGTTSWAWRSTVWHAGNNLEGAPCQRRLRYFSSSFRRSITPTETSHDADPPTGRGMALPILCLAFSACNKPDARAVAADPNPPAVREASRRPSFLATRSGRSCSPS